MYVTSVSVHEVGPLALSARIVEVGGISAVRSGGAAGVCILFPVLIERLS